MRVDRVAFVISATLILLIPPWSAGLQMTAVGAEFTPVGFAPLFAPPRAGYGDRVPMRIALDQLGVELAIAALLTLGVGAIGRADAKSAKTEPWRPGPTEPGSPDRANPLIARLDGDEGQAK